MTPTTTGPRVGDAFTHTRLIEPTWRPGPGEKYASAPKARCVVTRVTRDFVYYRYESSPRPNGAFKIDRATFARTYGDPQWR